MTRTTKLIVNIQAVGTYAGDVRACATVGPDVEGVDWRIFFGSQPNLDGRVSEFAAQTAATLRETATGIEAALSDREALCAEAAAAAKRAGGTGT